jgi:hypothetical protein
VTGIVEDLNTEDFRRRVLAQHDRGDTPHDVGVFVRHIALLADVSRRVLEFDPGVPFHKMMTFTPSLR